MKHQEVGDMMKQLNNLSLQNRMIEKDRSSLEYRQKVTLKRIAELITELDASTKENMKLNNRLEEAQYQFHYLKNNLGSDLERHNIKRELDDANSKLKAVTLEFEVAGQNIFKLETSKEDMKAAVSSSDDLLNKRTNQLKTTKDEKGLLVREIQTFQIMLEPTLHQHI